MPAFKSPIKAEKLSEWKRRSSTYRKKGYGDPKPGQVEIDPKREQDRMLMQATSPSIKGTGLLHARQQRARNQWEDKKCFICARTENEE